MMAGGIVLKNLSIKSTDEDGKVVSAAGEPIDGKIFKYMEISGLGLYVVPFCTESVDCSSPETLIHDMDAAFDLDHSEITPSQYILDTVILILLPGCTESNCFS